MSEHPEPPRDGAAPRHVLVVDDDADIRGLLRRLLEARGLVVSEAAEGREALRLLFDRRPDLVILDVTMPGMDGWQTLERIRDVSEVPVLMLTSLDAELEKVRGLQAGADDYLAKPFGRQELAARVQALLRRARGGSAPPPRRTYEDDHVRIDYAACSVEAGGQDRRLTPLEFRLLVALVEHPNQVLTPDQLLELVWGDALAAAPSQVKLYVGYLRRKLGLPADDGPIQTVRGFGYRYDRPRGGT